MAHKEGSGRGRPWFDMGRTQSRLVIAKLRGIKVLVPGIGRMVGVAAGSLAWVAACFTMEREGGEAASKTKLKLAMPRASVTCAPW